jgi:hypothetical protein
MRSPKLGSARRRPRSAPVSYAAAASAARRTRQACHKWRLWCAVMTCSPVARLKRIPRTKGFGNRTPARSRSAYSRRKARTSSCEVLKPAKASASGGAGRGLISRGAFILKRLLTGGSIILANQRPTNPGFAGPRLTLPRSRARIAGSFIACKYKRFAVARWSRHSATLHESASARQPPRSSLRSATSACASRSAASS